MLKYSTRVHTGWAIVAGLVIGWVLWMTLRPDSTINSINLIPFREHARAVRCLVNDCPTAIRAARFLIIDVLGNILVFLLVGWSLVGALTNLPRRRRWLVAVVVSAALSVGIEIIQLTIPSRATDVDDIVFNILGAVLGATVMLVIQCGLQREGDCL